MTCKAVREYGDRRARESAKQTTLQIALYLLKLRKYGDEEIASVTGLKLEEINNLKIQIEVEKNRVLPESNE